MSKKDYVTKLLGKLVPYWSEANTILTYLGHTEDAMYIDYLYTRLVTIIDKLLISKNTQQTQQCLQELNTIRDKESENQRLEQDQIDKLEQLLSSL